MLIGGDDISNDVITLRVSFHILFNVVALVSASGCLAEIWQLSRRGATGELEAEFKSQRSSYKISFLFLHAPPPERLQRPPLYCTAATFFCPEGGRCREAQL